MVLRAVVRSTATVKVTDPTRPRVIRETFIAVRDPIVPDLQRRCLGSAHIRLVRPLAVLALVAPSSTATGPTSRRLVRRWRRWDEVKTSGSSIYHGVQLVMATPTCSCEAVGAIPQLHFARVPDFFPSPGLAPDPVWTIKRPKLCTDGMTQVCRQHHDIPTRERLLIARVHLFFVVLF